MDHTLYIILQNKNVIMDSVCHMHILEQEAL
jgi:hypothetical protein